MSDAFASAGSLLSWDAAGAALTALHPWVSPGELHGVLCGAVCVAPPPSDDAWLELIWQHAGEDLGGQVDTVSLLQFRDQALTNLAADDLSFQMLLPADDVPLPDRVQALAAFCGGFLSGYGLAGGGMGGLDEDALEAMRGLAAIASADVGVDGTEDDESDFMEVGEFVRMAVLVLRDTDVQQGAGQGQAAAEDDAS